jgi:hypothetical protein
MASERFIPTCIGPNDAACSRVNYGLRPPPEAARSVLDGGEHGVPLARGSGVQISLRSCALEHATVQNAKA